MTTAIDGATWIPAATFRMGSDAHHAEEGPVRAVAVDGFWIGTHQVTNRAFAAFVEDTRYVTVAERPLDAAVFRGADLTSNTYYDWLIDNAFIVLAGTTLTAQFLGTFEEFPPRQKLSLIHI